MHVYVHKTVQRHTQLYHICTNSVPLSKHIVKQAFREFLVSPALIRNYKAVIYISFIWLQYLNQNCMKKLFRCLSSVCAARPYIW